MAWEDVELCISKDEVDRWAWIETSRLVRVTTASAEGQPEGDSVQTRETHETVEGFEFADSSETPGPEIRKISLNLADIRPPYYEKQEGIPPAPEKAIELYLQRKMTTV